MCLITELEPGFNPFEAVEILNDSEATMNKDGVSLTDVYTNTVTWGYCVEDITHMLDPEKHYVVHQRYATRGSNGSSLRHPFKVDDELWLMHNGTLSETYLKQWEVYSLPESQSDTSALAAKLFATAPLSGYSPQQLMARLKRDLEGNVLTLIGYGQVLHSEPLIALKPCISVSNLYSLSYTLHTDIDNSVGFYDTELNMYVYRDWFESDDAYYDEYDLYLNRELMELNF